MHDKDNKPPEPPSLDSIEGGLFDALFEFYEKVMALLRAANLGEDKLVAISPKVSIFLGRSTTFGRFLVRAACISGLAFLLTACSGYDCAVLA